MVKHKATKSPRQQPSLFSPSSTGTPVNKATDQEPSLFEKVRQENAKVKDSETPPQRARLTERDDILQIVKPPSLEFSRHGSVYSHKDSSAGNRFRTSVIYVTRDLGSQQFGRLIALRLRHSLTDESRWITGHREICSCHSQYFGNCATRSPDSSNCAAYGISSFLAKQLKGSVEEWQVLEVIPAAEKTPRIKSITLVISPQEPTLHVPLIRNALRTSCIAIGMTGEIIALGGRIFKYKINDISTYDGQSEVGYVDPADSIKLFCLTEDQDRTDADQGEPRGFARIGGCDLILNSLDRSLIAPLSSPESFLASDGSLTGLRPVKGVLLYGVPGTGKSYLCRAIEEELQIRWRARKPSPIASNVTVQVLNGANIRDDQDLSEIFRRARDRYDMEKTLTLLIIDEIDSLCPKRQDSTSDERIAIINCLLTHLDGSSSNWSTFLLATTNRPDAIDEALRRPGRLDKEIELLVPPLKARCLILMKLLSRYGISTDSLDDQKLERLCSKASGFVPSDIDAWVRLTAEGMDGLDSQNNLLESLSKTVKLISPSALKEFSVEVPKVSWADIGGYEDVKKLLQESVEWPIKFAETFKALDLQSSKGILLYGPPGNSKTLMAKAVANQSSMNFIAVKGPELFSKYVGESERKLREIFKRARQYAPTIIFFDEIDSIGTDRAKSHSTNSVEARLLSQLLNEMDGIELSADVIVLAATNRPDAIDSALLRPGRFDKLVYVSLPDFEARKQIFSVYLPQMSASETEALAKISQGYSGAEIEQICRAAKLSVFRRFVRDGRSSIDLAEQISVSVVDVEKEISETRPRTSSTQIEYYEQFASQKF